MPFLIKKKRYGLHQHHDRSVRPVLLCEGNRYVLVNFFVNSTRWHDEGAIIHVNSAIILSVIHQRLGKSNIQVVILPL